MNAFVLTVSLVVYGKISWMKMVTLSLHHALI